MCQAPIVWLNRKGGTMTGSGGCGRSLGAGAWRGHACTRDPQPMLFIPKVGMGLGVGVGESSP